jgi:hypothetical protein
MQSSASNDSAKWEDNTNAPGELLVLDASALPFACYMSTLHSQVVTLLLGTYNAFAGGRVSPYERLRQRRGRKQREDGKYDGKMHGCRGYVDL